jgi:hypothetical protein
MKKSFLVLYDYGMGGVWAIIDARSEDEIIDKYPMLTVRESRPAWMTDEKYDKTASTLKFDIDDPPTGWLLALAESK